MSTTPKIWLEFRNSLFARDFGTAGEMLKQTPALLHMTDNLGETALHFLAVEGDLASVEWLRKRGADINTKNIFGTPVIFEVAQLGDIDLTLWFITQGASLDATNSLGDCLTDHLLEYGLNDMCDRVQKNTI